MSEENSSSRRSKNIVPHSISTDRQIVALSLSAPVICLVIRGLKPGAHLGLYDPRARRGDLCETEQL